MPWLTLYHWDLPQALQDRGGWTDRDTAYRFADYAVAVHEALGDRVRVWTTLNEPWCSSFLSYAGGEHAPGRTDPTEAIAAAHHLLLGHGLAARALRERDGDATLGITLNFTVADPADPADPADVDAARRIDGAHNRIFLDPIFRGEYPADVLADMAAHWPAGLVHDGDLATIAAPIDVLGVNYYNGGLVAGPAAPDGEPADGGAAAAGDVAAVGADPASADGGRTTDGGPGQVLPGRRRRSPFVGSEDVRSVPAASPRRRWAGRSSRRG